MKQTEFSYSIKELFASPKLALSPKKIAIGTCFLLFAYATLVLWTYLSILIDGERLSVAINVYGIFPPFLEARHSTVATAFSWIGYLWTLLFAMHGVLAVALVTLEELRGNPFLSISDSIRHSLARMPQLLGAVLGIAFLTLLFVVVLALFGLVADIPAVGESVWSLLLLIPSFVVSFGLVGMVYLIGSAAVTFLPSIVAAEKPKEIFGPIVEVFSIMLRQPGRWFSYTLFAVLLSKLAGFVYAYVTTRAIELIARTAEVGSGKVAHLIGGGLSHLPLESKFLHLLFTLYPGSDWGIPFSALPVRDSGDFASYLCAAMLFIILMSIPAYILSTFAVASTRGYAVILFAKDGRKLTEEPPLFTKPGTTESAG